jgi:hypothetical protein
MLVLPCGLAVERVPQSRIDCMLRNWCTVISFMWRRLPYTDIPTRVFLLIRVESKLFLVRFDFFWSWQNTIFDFEIFVAIHNTALAITAVARSERRSLQLFKRDWRVHQNLRLLSTRDPFWLLGNPVDAQEFWQEQVVEIPVRYGPSNVRELVQRNAPLFAGRQVIEES